MWGTPPRQSPSFQKSASGVMMGPNPLLTQRRSEHKRPPAPPKIIANLYNFGHEGWLGSPGSVDALLRVSKQKLGMWYGWEHLDISDVTAKHDADVRIRTPILYLCAFYPLDLKPAEMAALRTYVLQGGLLLINCCGQEASYDSARRELETMFPKRPLRLLPSDHPVYRSHFKVERVHWPVDMLKSHGAKDLDELSELEDMAGIAGESVDVTELPRLRGVTIGTRAGVVVSLEDMACGWNQWDNRAVKRYSLADSNAIGANIMTYALSELRYAKFLTSTHEIKGPSVAPRRQLVLPQLIHDGNWDPNPSAVPYLLKALAETTSMSVKFERRQFELHNPDLFAYPLLYMTGTWDPKLNEAEIAILRRHLSEGGCLLADSAAGRMEFDRAFRKLVGKLFPDAGLKKLKAGHPLFRSYHQIEKLHVNHQLEPVEPEVEAVFHEDRPVVLYSPLGLCDGWSQQYSAYARCYETEDAIRLASNMIVYLMLTVRESGDTE